MNHEVHNGNISKRMNEKKNEKNLTCRDKFGILYLLGEWG